MNFLSVCSGIEAASVAWTPLGWKAVGFSEIEKFPCAVLAHHYPDVPNYGDMTKFDKWPDMEFDLLCGGTPCQAFSVAGKREGLKDDRGNLTLTFCGIADRYNPRWIMWENVPGVLSSQDNAFGCFLAELCGADAPIEPVGGRWPNAGVVAGSKRTAAWRVLDAQFVRVDGYAGAVPQRRRRVFVVACPGTTGDPASVLFEPEGVRRHSAPRRETGKGAAEDVGSGSAAGSHWDGEGNAHPSLNQSHNTGGIGASNQEVFSQRGAGLVPDTCGVITAGISKGPRGTEAVDSDQLIPSVVGALTDGAHNGGGLNGQDAYSGRIFPVAIHDKATRNKGGGADRKDDGAGNGLGVSETGEMYTLTSGDKHAVCCAPVAPCMTSGGAPFERTGDERTECEAVIAFSCKDNGRDCVEGVAPTLRSMGTDKSHANGGGQLAVGIGGGSEVAAFTYSKNSNGLAWESVVSPTIQATPPTDGMNQQYGVRDSMQVRRLTPRECERLQGFPDDYTQIPWRKKAVEDCPDGPRYKALGNSWAVNCARWVGTRIQMVEDLVINQQQKGK